MTVSSYLRRALPGVFLFAATDLAAANVLWHIGVSDRSPAEFALAPNHWRQFKSDAFFIVGESDAKRDWPYVQPGPVDAWAGGTAHTFTVLFGLQTTPAGGECRLACDLVDTQGRAAPKLRIQINGQWFDRAPATGGGDATLNGNLASARGQEVAVTFPASLLRRGDNVIQISTVSGSWLLYDSLRLEAPEGATLARPLVRSVIEKVQPVQALRSTNGRLMQPVQVTLRHSGGTGRATIRLDGAAPVTIELKPGANLAEVAVPALEQPEARPLHVEIDGQPLPAVSVDLKPVRRMTLYLLPMSHTDIGYTEIQTAIEKKQVQNLVDGMAAARATANYPVGARFVWNVEVLWAADLYLQRMSEPQRAEFLAAVKSGQVALNGMYLNELTGLCRPEELLRLFRYATQLAERCGTPIDTAMISDVPGYTWGTVPAMAQAGIRYFSAAPNWFDRIGDFLVQWQNKPFYWVSPSGREKVLVWIPFKGYALSHIYRKLSPQLLSEIQDDLDKVAYPYDIAYTRWAGHGDNAVPDPAICDFVRDWNAEYAWPRLIISSASEAFHALEQRYADKIPVRRGDLTPYWEDGAASSARETSMNRNTAERLTQAETLWALREPGRYPASAFDAAWRHVLLYSEHTWGASGSVWDPESQRTKEQWEIKRGYAEQADAASHALLARAEGRNPESQPVTSATKIDVYNTSSWPRTELVVLGREVSAGRDRVVDARGKAVPAQRLSTGELAFMAQEVPPFAAVRFGLEAGAAVAPKSVATAKGFVLENGEVKVRVDEATGAIVELRARGIDQNLVKAGALRGLNDYAYLRGDDVGKLEHNGITKVTVKEAGPLVASLVVESAAPGCNRLTREVRVVAGLPEVELINTLDKQRAPITPRPGDHEFAQKGGKESVNFGFSFNVPEGDIQIDLPIGAMRPAHDQLPGGCKNWFTVGRWVDVANRAFGVTCVTLDAPLIEVGGITATLLGSQRDPSVWRSSVEPTQTFYSWVMNNHWGTNYRAYQEGLTTFRYVLIPHQAANPAANTRAATAFTQPLLVLPATGPDVASVPRLNLSTDDVVVTSMKPSDDGHAWIVRLYGASGKDSDVALNWADPAQMYMSDTTERAGKKIEGKIAVPAWDVVTIRAEGAAARKSRP